MFGELIEIIVYVEDMAAQVAFYRDVLGLRVTWPDVGDFSGEHWVTFATGAATLALHSGGEQRQRDRQGVSPKPRPPAPQQGS